MKKYTLTFIFVLCTLINVLWLVVCGPSKQKAKCDPQVDNDMEDDEILEIDEEITKYEMEHSKEYATNKRIYQEWPELKLKDTVKICENYLLMLRPKTVFMFLEASVKKITMQYKQLKNCKIRQMKLTALECFHALPGTAHVRSYFHFVRAPKLDCMYLLDRTKPYNIMHIRIELCDSDTFDSLKISGRLHKVRPLSHSRPSPCRYDTSELQEKYEREHLKDYSRHRDIYSKWWEIELKNKETDEYCRIFIKKLHPKTKCPSGLRSKQTFIRLSYLNILDAVGLGYSPVIVSTLTCNLPTPINQRRTYQFIKAPNVGSSECVYRVNKERNSSLFRITQKLCEDEVTD